MQTAHTDNQPTAPAGKQKLDPELIYLPHEVSTYLGVTTSTLAKWRCHRRGPSFIKLGRVISYRGRDVLAYEARCVVELEG